MPYFYSPFRTNYGPKEAGEVGPCPFCSDEIRQRQILRDLEGRAVENDYYMWVANWYPRYEGHTLLVPKKHVADFTDETAEELYARQHLLAYIHLIIVKVFTGAGIEVFLQTGAGSESSVKHHHWHVVPSAPHDALRGMEKVGFFTTTKEGEQKVLFFPTRIEHAKSILLATYAPILSECPYSPPT